ncbi:MAG: hypothetical protein M0Z67_04185 [Nitrospiraceae bacterium]|nr:hypothetical protein [Nitrospiraceae bacterium]
MNEAKLTAGMIEQWAKAKGMKINVHSASEFPKSHSDALAMGVNPGKAWTYTEYDPGYRAWDEGQGAFRSLNDLVIHLAYERLTIDVSDYIDNNGKSHMVDFIQRELARAGEAHSATPNQTAEDAALEQRIKDWERNERDIATSERPRVTRPSTGPGR